jgi:hypothetical protein
MAIMVHVFNSCRYSTQWEEREIAFLILHLLVFLCYWVRNLAIGQILVKLP